MRPRTCSKSCMACSPSPTPSSSRSWWSTTDRPTAPRGCWTSSPPGARCVSSGAAGAAARGDYLIVHDADHEYDPGDIPRLLQPLLDGEADVVYGSRFRREGTRVHRTFHFLVNRLLTDLSNALSGIYLTDMETCYK